MSKVYFDLETRSRIPIEYGRFRYAHDEYADILCMAYRIDDNPTQIWIPSQNPVLPYEFIRPASHTFYAFNIQFDQLMMNILGKRYGAGTIYLSQCRDVMALAGRYSLPQKLERLGATLKVELPKLSTGKQLLKIFSVPPFHNPKKSREWHNKKFKQLCEYCIRDVDCMCEIISKLPTDELEPEEQHIWQVTATINARGVPIDIQSARSIRAAVNIFTSRNAARIPEITGGAIQTIGQIKKIREWCESEGCDLPNLQKQTIEDALANGSLPPKVEELLRLRLMLNSAAVKKYDRLINMTYEGRIYDNLRYYGANTGRPTGGGFQFLNLPRAHTDEPEELIQKFNDLSILQDEDVLESAKKLVRPMVKTPEGKILNVADYSSIEYILLMWYSEQMDKVELFEKGEDPYKLFASRFYQISVEEVTKDMRQWAKPPVLGGGYMLSYNGLVSYAEGFGVDLTLAEAKRAIDYYRSEHPLVVQMWYQLREKAIQAVMHKQTRYVVVNGVQRTVFVATPDRSGILWLCIRLPSGRYLYYRNPCIVTDKYDRLVIEHERIDPTTKQWVRGYLPPQRIIENIIQGLGRDILNHGMDKLIEYDFTPIGQVYDEIITEEKGDRLEEMINLMCIRPSWAKELPLKAEGFVSKRYKKG